MDICIPPSILKDAASWPDLSRWDRAELGRSLRRLGLSYGEIREIIPVPKGTLAHWCREIELSEEQAAAIVARTGTQAGVPRDTQRKRRLEIAAIRDRAASQVGGLRHEPLWVAGTVLYWAEGTKSQRSLSLANSDPRACRLFITWTRQYHLSDAVFVLKLNLHADNDEPAARGFWRAELDMPRAEFYKTFIKPDGTGHRRNHLAHGVCQVRMRRSADAWHRTMAWIDALAEWTDDAHC
jgi:hypothetical protein